MTTEFDFTKQVGHLLRKAVQKNQAIYSRLCVDPRMTSVQFAVMYVLEKHGPCSLALIGRKADIDAATTRDVVKRLEMRGLVAIQQDPSDRRKSFVSLEPAGMEMVNAMRPRSQQVAELTMEGLTPAEQVALVYLLEKITATPAPRELNADGDPGDEADESLRSVA
ncbi:MAG: MarR family transcriptional regulator [Pigmentiphaga sp.]|uniref:MarR family winged helix-turn-helix transcriptional regulator n=1 Tax=Pigmentiphaga sp. TaxID=1977564 RepID=UPI0029BC8E7E|nr:MarR family transcriptional regulator [Pigmentiphaga sp.]MDX3906382.1 MarR family transcriptional regulator [Pigmentiphaga sp.]